MLVNNAGIGYEGPVEGYSKKQIDHMILLNVRAIDHAYCTYSLPELKTPRKVIYH